MKVSGAISQPRRNRLSALAGLGFGIVLALGACHRGLQVPKGEVEVQVAQVGLDDASGTAVLLLKERHGSRVLPIWIGGAEARAILLKLHRITPPRPLTSDLLKEVLDATGARVDRVEITDLRDQTYYAVIYLNGGKQKLDSRPSDAIALALRCGAPIYAATELLESSGEIREHRARRRAITARSLGIIVQELSPDMASFFSVKPGSGVLVADLDTAAKHAGLQRGDVIAQLGGRRIHDLGEFAAALRHLEGNSSVSTVVMRAGQRILLTLPVKSLS